MTTTKETPKTLDWDILVSDLEGLENSGMLQPVIQQIKEKWYPEESGKCPRCGTIHISNDSDGNGELRISLRFPFDMEQLIEIDTSRARGKKFSSETYLRVVAPCIPDGVPDLNLSRRPAQDSVGGYKPVPVFDKE